MIGKIVSHYKILEKLGEGGMGEVYLAEDTRLERKVALKFLPPKLTVDPEARERFRREAKAAAALNHPGIVTIYEIDEFEGQTYIAMEYIEGEALSEKIKARAGAPLECAEAIDIARQIADGLSAAHRAGIVHRDVKPQNILIDKTGRVRILDFGLAKLRGVSHITREASTLGTVSYMSPEQVRGEEVDQRSDIWSFGVVLYEMLAGRRPFRGEYEQAVMYAIMSDDPEPVANVRPDLPKGLVGLVRRALAKRPDERYQAFDDCIDDLASLPVSKSGRIQKPVAARSSHRAMKFYIPAAVVAIIVAGFFVVRGLLPEKAEAIDSLAVLPFQNLSADPDQEYFSDGMTEALIAELSKIKALRVISRTSVMRFKESDKSLPQIARELGVAAVIEGSVQRVQDEVRVTAQLVRAAPEQHLWANTYTQSYRNILVLESEMALAIAREIRITVTPEDEERLAASRQVNPAAHEAYLKGRYYFNRLTQNDIERARQCFEEAVSIDSTYALAYVGLAEVCDYYAPFVSPRDIFPQMTAYARKALSIDGTIAEAYAILGDVEMMYEWDWRGAEENYRRAIALNPNDATSHGYYGMFLTIMGRSDEALAEAIRAKELDPLSGSMNMILGFIYFVRGQYDRAEEQSRRILSMDSSFASAYGLIGNIRFEEGRFEESAAQFERAVTTGDPSYGMWLAAAQARSGKRDEARRRLAEAMRMSETGYQMKIQIASVYLALGESDSAFYWLERAYEDHEMLFLRFMPGIEGIRSDPRYIDLMKRMGLQP